MVCLLQIWFTRVFFTVFAVFCQNKTYSQNKANFFIINRELNGLICLFHIVYVIYTTHNAYYNKLTHKTIVSERLNHWSLVGDWSKIKMCISWTYSLFKHHAKKKNKNKIKEMIILAPLLSFPQKTKENCTICWCL